MELLPYRSLLDVIEDDGPRTPAEAAHVGLQILAALRAAHALDIADVAGGGGPAEGGAGRDGEVDQRGERRGRPGRGAGTVVVVVFAGAAAFVLPFGHVGAAVPAGIVVVVAAVAVAVAGGVVAAWAAVAGPAGVTLGSRWGAADTTRPFRMIGFLSGEHASACAHR